MVSYCNSNDTFCDSGDSIAVHLSYVQNNGTAAMNFIMSQAKSDAGGASGGNGNGNPIVTSSEAMVARSFGNGMIALMALALGLLL